MLNYVNYVLKKLVLLLNDEIIKNKMASNYLLYTNRMYILSFELYKY